ncbi:unnamed protein product [Toxocara canis]|uniref:protein-tyrosine-phosphatase n=1 Tax=Toxocara canis TaxID=6265 RepID=A0A183TUZ7_TOXCA|nr:unnamed protein product [Toxocara canis]
MGSNEARVIIMRKFVASEDEMRDYDYNAQFAQIRTEQDVLRAKPEYSCEVGADSKYFCKNRYRDIIPYDRNRVRLSSPKLSEGAGVDGGGEGYINASYIHVPPADAKYIAAQAPMSTTLHDWFAMIRENDVAVVVMLCKLVELGKAKCERYWPEEVGTEGEFGDVMVCVEEETHYEEYCSRRLRLKWSDGEQRSVQQLHYSEWPDHGCPESEHHVLQMIELFDKLHYQQPEKPVLVHCSAGCGRTGTIIAANVIRELINAQTIANDLKIYDLVMQLRTQRVSMVQTPEQYQFLHKLVRHYCCEKLLALGEELPKKVDESASCERRPESSPLQVERERCSPESVPQSKAEANCARIVTIPGETAVSVLIAAYLELLAKNMQKCDTDASLRALQHRFPCDDYPEEPELKPLGPEPMPVSWNEGNAITS